MNGEIVREANGRMGGWTDGVMLGYVVQGERREGDDAYLEFSKCQSCHFSGRLSSSICVRLNGGRDGIVEWLLWW